MSEIEAESLARLLQTIIYEASRDGDGCSVENIAEELLQTHGDNRRHELAECIEALANREEFADVRQKIAAVLLTELVNELDVCGGPRRPDHRGA